MCNCLTPEDKISLGCSEEALWCYILAVLIYILNNSEWGKDRERDGEELISEYKVTASQEHRALELCGGCSCCQPDFICN